MLTYIPAINLFGLLLAIAIFGLMKSNAEANRMHRYAQRSDHPTLGREPVTTSEQETSAHNPDHARRT